jgi:hypothetical protein
MINLFTAPVDFKGQGFNEKLGQFILALFGVSFSLSLSLTLFLSLPLYLSLSFSLPL